MGIPLKASVEYKFEMNIILKIHQMFGQDGLSECVSYVAEQLGAFAVQLAGSAYPPPQRTRGSAPSPLHTAKQWRWWWAMMNRLADGQDVPEGLHGWKAVHGIQNGRPTLILSGSYFRTGTLERGITYDVEAQPGVRNVRVGPSGNSKLYEEYVIGQPPKQARYHQGNWKPLVEVLLEHDKEFQILASKAMGEWFDKKLAAQKLK